LISPNKFFHRALNLLYPIDYPKDQGTVFQDHTGTASQEKSSPDNNETESDLNDEDLKKDDSCTC